MAKDILSLIDEAPLGGRYWRAVGLLALVSVFDYFDFFLVGFLLSVVGPLWQLNYAQSSVILLAAGVGAIVGSVAWGYLADRFGRKGLLIAAITVCSLSSGAIAFIPDGAWITFAVLRFLVGVGVGGAATASIALAVEYTPTRVRTAVTGALVIPAGLGVLLASLVTSQLLDVMGWRGLAALGFSPLAFAFVAAFLVPESARWLLSAGRLDEARRVVARQLGLPLERVGQFIDEGAEGAPTGFAELYADRRRFWLVVLIWFGLAAASYGVLLWGPTVVSLLLSVSPQEAAKGFALVAVMGLIGRVVFALAPHWLGRRLCGQIIGFGAAAALAGAALWHDQFVGALPAFVLLLAVGALFFDGGTANLGPYPAELFPVRMAARGTGLGQAANGIGKIVGPLCLALIAGADNYMTPAATAEAVQPAFFFLAGCALLVGLAFTFLGIETHGRRLALSDRSRPTGAGNGDVA